jgi:hypothetical protein
MLQKRSVCKNIEKKKVFLHGKRESTKKGIEKNQGNRGKVTIHKRAKQNSEKSINQGILYLSLHWPHPVNFYQRLLAIIFLNENIVLFQEVLSNKLSTEPSYRANTPYAIKRPILLYNSMTQQDKSCQGNNRFLSILAI